jgi:hypothetical protein
MPHKAYAARRNHIPRPKRRVTNSAEYAAALRQRGSLTVWFTDAAIAAWQAAPRTTPGGQPCYSDLVVTTALMLRAVFRLALRQTEGLIGSILRLLGLDLPVPDHTGYRDCDRRRSPQSHARFRAPEVRPRCISRDQERDLSTCRTSVQHADFGLDLLDGNSGHSTARGPSDG